MRNLLLILLCFPLLLPSARAGEPAHDPLPGIARAYLVEIDGKAAWEHQPRRQLPAASMNKLMTALLITERGKLQAPVRIDRAAAHQHGIGLRAGERFRTGDLLAAMLVASANDACRALADAVAGSAANFVRQMNLRAQQLGLRDTRYANACGRDAAQQHTSAHDLALLARELLRHPGIAALTARRGARIATLDGKRSYSFASRNALLGRVRGVLGLKTGYTRQAGRCQVIYAERDGHKVLLVILHGRRWGDAADMLELAFDRARHPVINRSRQAHYPLHLSGAA